MELPFYARVAVSLKDAIDKVASGCALTAVFGLMVEETMRFSAVIVCKDIAILKALEDLYPSDALRRGRDLPGRLPSLLIDWPFINLRAKARSKEICGDVELQLLCSGIEARRLATSGQPASPRA